MVRIAPVIPVRQHGEVHYSFALPVKTLLELGRIERFGEDPNGVQRKLNPKHMDRILDAMVHNAQALFLEPIIGNLEGEWRFEEGTLIGEETGYLTIDDGGHRFEACRALLSSDEQYSWEFDIKATMGLPYERRLKIFRQQMLRRPIDSRLSLAQRKELNDWENPVQGEAYALCTELNTRPSSPLRGMIIMDEQIKRPYQGRHKPIGINVTGLMSTLQRVLGVNGPLVNISSARRAQLVIDFIAMAKEIWPREWGNKTYVLTSSRGISALLMLFTNSPNFRGAIGEDFRRDKVHQALALASSFNWAQSNHRSATVVQIVHRLDHSISRNRATRGSGTRSQDLEATA